MKRDKNTADRLRHEIDSGKTGDKVDFPDPAAAPLGTDDEASGHPVTPEQAAIARAHEVGRDTDPAPPPREGDPHRPLMANPGARLPAGAAWVLLMLAVLMVLVLVVWALTGG